jgi:cytochrome c-type biogenesis protein CcmE
MNRTVRVVSSALVIIGAACVFMYFATAKEAEYYKHVDEVMADPAQWYGKNLSLHGFVDGVPLHRPNSLDYKFKVKSGSFVVDATYTGLIPDTFKEGSEIVARGQLAADGFHADNITAKCPSRYESAKTGTDDNK